MALPAENRDAAPARTGRTRTRFWQRALLAVMTRTAGWLRKMPRARAMRYGERFGHFAHFLTRYVSRRPQRYAHRNLRITGFPRPDMTFAERDAFIRRVFVHFAKSAVDFLRGPALTREELTALVRVDGLEHLEAARARGKGIIFVSAHLGNWELAARLLVANGFPLTTVAREPEDGGFADYVRSLRENGGYRVLYRGSTGVRELLSVLKRNETIALLPDQNSGDFFLPFFGVPAGTVAGPASLALHTGATLIVGACVRLPDDTYRAVLLPPVNLAPTNDRAADTRRVMAEVNRQIESLVREYPDQWLWVHNRWKAAFEEGNRARAFPEGIPPDLLARWEE
jgi:Kdo2-lipid IVA lauroyltransferase/acyltransferase